jgi:uncharacterized protein (DUF111 family)
MAMKLTRFDLYRLEREVEDIEVTIGRLELNLQWYKNQLAFVKSKLEDVREKVDQPYFGGE